MSIGYILIVISMATSVNNYGIHVRWTVVTMQRFVEPKACQAASLEILKRARGEVQAVCVPEAA